MFGPVWFNLVHSAYHTVRNFPKHLYVKSGKHRYQGRGGPLKSALC